LYTPDSVQRRIAVALDPPGGIPISFTMANEDDTGRWPSV
jgi:hypothetical protein